MIIKQQAPVAAGNQGLTQNEDATALLLGGLAGLVLLQHTLNHRAGNCQGAAGQQAGQGSGQPDIPEDESCRIPRSIQDGFRHSLMNIQARFAEDVPFICLFYRSGAILTRKMFTTVRSIREFELLQLNTR